MKILQVFTLLLFLTSFAKAQACGYTFLTIYLTDSKGQIIKNADIKTFGKDFKKEDSLHYPKNEVDYDILRKSISWSEKKQAYFGSEGMCGGHRNVGLRISAVGFETFDKIIDLPLGWTSYSIKLKRKGTDEIAVSENLSKIFGRILDLNGVGITKAGITVFSKENRIFKTHTNLDGVYELFLPIGQYRLEIYAEGFRRQNLEKFSISENKNLELNLALTIGDITDYPPVRKNKK